MLQLSKLKIQGYKMRKRNLTALLLGAALFTGMGMTSASAESMKCGTGKCGEVESTKSVTKCGAEKKAVIKTSKCGAEKKAEKCGAEKKAAKCGANK